MRKITATLLTFAMLLTALTSVFADMPEKEYTQKFYDVAKDHWAFSYIAELVDRGVISGYEDGSFKPTNTVSRAEFAKIMVGAAGVPTNDSNVYFTDMQNHWAITYVNAAKDYLTAYADNTYRPSQAAVREDVTMAMVKLKGYDISNVDFSYLSDFKDTDSISNNVKAYVAVAVEKGLISGFEDNTFRGQATLTRAEAATLLWNAFQYGSDNKVTDTSNSTSLSNQGSSSLVEKIEPTVAPTAIPTTSATPATTQSAPKVTEEPSISPTIEPTDAPVATEKPYKIETLVKTDIGSCTYDNNGTIYYTNDDEIYSLNADGENKVVFDADDMAEYDDFGTVIKSFSMLDNICCDTNGNIYVEASYRDYGVFKIEDGEAELFKKIGKGFKNRPLLLVVDDNLITTNSQYGIAINHSTSVPMSNNAILAAEYNNNIVIADSAGGIFEYDYNTSTTLVNPSGGTAGISSDGYVIEKDGKFIIRSYDEKTEIKFSFDDCEVKDKLAFKIRTYDILFLMPDNNVVFYDVPAKAFRLISKN